MTPRERMDVTMRGGKVDRFFRYDLGAWPSTIKRWKQEGMPADTSYDACFKLDPLFTLPFATGYTDSPLFPAFERKILESGVGWEIIRDRDGITKKIFSEGSDLSMPQFLSFPMQSRADWPTIERLLKPSNAEKILGDTNQAAKKLHGMSDTPVIMRMCGGFGHPRNLLGDEHLYYTLFDDPELIHEILDNWLALYKEIILVLTATIKVDIILIWEDMCYKNGPLISPEHFREFIFPRYEALIAFAKAQGISYAWVDTDGDCLKLIPLFVEAGVDAILPFEVQAGMDVIEIRKSIGDNFTIIGGIDKRALAGTREDIRREVDRVLPFFLESGKYIPCLDHTAPVNISYDNFCYYLDCLRRYE